jgi:Flp pilus assembly pilin Flp
MRWIPGVGKLANLIRLCEKFARDDSGQAITEYVLIMSIALGSAALITRGLMKILDQFTLAFGAQLEKDLKAGRASSAQWKN